MSELMARFSVDEQQVREVPTPSGTSTHRPIPHGVLIDATCQAIAQRGLTVDRMQFGLAKDGQRMFGVLDCVADQTGGLLDQVAEATERNGSGIRMAVGLRNAHDKAFSAQLVAGGHVLVCDNLMFSGEVKLGRKHTPNIMRDLDGLAARAMGAILGYAARESRIVANMKRLNFNPAQASHMLVEAVRSGATPGSKIAKVIGLWDDCPHEEYLPGTAWHLFNAFTQVNRERSEQAQMSTDLMSLFTRMIPALAQKKEA